jgi:raffinose/stachyose/melibiose transport system permease protein
MTKNESFFRRLGGALIFAGPTVFIFLVVVIVPFLYGVFLTLTNWNGIASSFQFVGLKNYASLFQSGEFWTTFFLTLEYVGLTLLFTNVIAFFLASLLTSGLRGQNVLRSALFTPNLVGGIILGFIWRFIFSTALVYFGKRLHISFLSVSALGDPVGALWAMVIATVWQYSGYMMIIYIAGFMSIPRMLIEAASIDGANGFTRVRSIIVPLMVPSFIICGFLTLQRSFMVYAINLSLTGGGPYNSTMLISLHVYQKAFLFQQYGTGQAEAFVLFFIVAIVSVIQIRFGKGLEVEA